MTTTPCLSLLPSRSHVIFSKPKPLPYFGDGFVDSLRRSSKVAPSSSSASQFPSVRPSFLTPLAIRPSMATRSEFLSDNLFSFKDLNKYVNSRKGLVKAADDSAKQFYDPSGRMALTKEHALEIIPHATEEISVWEDMALNLEEISPNTHAVLEFFSRVFNPKGNKLKKERNAFLSAELESARINLAIAKIKIANSQLAATEDNAIVDKAFKDLTFLFTYVRSNIQ